MRAGARLWLSPCACAIAPVLTAKIQNDLRILTERLARINDNLARKVSSRTEYDKTITEVHSLTQPLHSPYSPHSPYSLTAL